MTGAARKPAYRLRVDGADITPSIRPRLVLLDITDNRGFEADTLTLDLDDSDGLLALPPRGARVEVWIGWEGEALEDKGSYIVDELEHNGPPDTLTLRARSADLRTGLSTKRECSYADVTCGDVVRTIAARNGLQVAIGADLDALAIEHTDQTNESDVNLLTRMARDLDAIATVKAGRLLFMRAGQATTASGEPLPGIIIQRSSGDTHRFAVADRAGYTGVVAHYHDLRAAERSSVFVSDDAPYIPGAGSGPVGGVKTLSHTYVSKKNAERAAREEWQKLQRQGNRQEYTGVRAQYWKDKARTKKADVLAGKDSPKPAAPPPTEPSGESNKVLRHVYANRTNALRAADAEWKRLKRGMATFAITLAEGRADLFPELPVTVRGFKAEIDNTGWIITRCVHKVSNSGFVTALDLEIKPTELGDD